MGEFCEPFVGKEESADQLVFGKQTIDAKNGLVGVVADFGLVVGKGEAGFQLEGGNIGQGIVLEGQEPQGLQGGGVDKSKAANHGSSIKY